jgi:hypothetical protein
VKTDKWFYELFLSQPVMLAELLPGIDASWTFIYQKASGKPLALAMGMNTVVALATLKNVYPKTLKMRIIRL